MRVVWFAGLAALTAAGPAFAEIALFGNARLGLGYNITNSGALDTEATTRTVPVLDADGDPVLDDDGNPVTAQERIPDNELEGNEDLRAVSRVRFGVRMTGESDSGIAFGAEIRADNAGGAGTGDSSSVGQRSGSVFVSGSYGTLTFGDINGADEFRVGNVESTTGRVGLTSFDDFDDIYFGSNGNDTGSDRQGFVRDGDNTGRPTVRYDYDFDAIPLGISLSTNRDLQNFVIGANYLIELEAGTIGLGAGYAEITEYVARAGNFVPDYDQISVGATAAFGDFSGFVGYLDTDGQDDAELEQIIVSLAYSFDALTINGFYSDLITATGDTSFGLVGEGDFYAFGASYDLGGGARVIGGVAEDTAGNTMADFGITMRF